MHIVPSTELLVPIMMLIVQRVEPLVLNTVQLVPTIKIMKPTVLNVEQKVQLVMLKLHITKEIFRRAGQKVRKVSRALRIVPKALILQRRALNIKPQVPLNT